MTLPLFAGWMLDMLLGTPAWMPHPAMLVSRFIANLESVLRGVFPQNPRGERQAGALLALLATIVPLLTVAVVLASIWLFSQSLWLALDTLLCYQLLSARRLRSESIRVCDLLENKEEHGDLSRARLALSRLAVRDTEKLNRHEITRAAVENVAKNTTEEVIAPMFFIALGGGALGIFYKSVTLLARMVGRETNEYRYFGMAACKLNECCGFIPARIAAWIMTIAAGMSGFDSKEASNVRKNTRKKLDGTNRTETEAVLSGALGIQLGGGAYYGGTYHHEPLIGEGKRLAEPKDIRGASRIMILSSLIGIIFFCFIKIAILYIISISY